MRALVTGASGFVGRHMREALVERGYTVVGIDLVGDQSGGPLSSIAMDVRHWFAHDTERYDLVVHCAAVVGGRRQIEGAPLSLAVDLAIDAGLYEWALRTRPAAIVYYSSSAAYPARRQDADPPMRLREDQIDLDWIDNPDQLYGWAKLSGEMLAAHARADGLRVLTPRPFSGYGEDQALDYPWPSFIDRARRRADPFDVWGDGTQVRDWVHIDDVVGATLAALDAEIDGPFNICTGRATSFNDLAAMVTAAAGYTPTIRHLTDEPRGVAYRVGDPTYMRSFYEPKVRLEDAIARALSPVRA